VLCLHRVQVASSSDAPVSSGFCFTHTTAATTDVWSTHIAIQVSAQASKPPTIAFCACCSFSTPSCPAAATTATHTCSRAAPRCACPLAGGSCIRCLTATISISYGLSCSRAQPNRKDTWVISWGVGSISSSWLCCSLWPQGRLYPSRVGPVRVQRGAGGQGGDPASSTAEGRHSVQGWTSPCDRFANDLPQHRIPLLWGVALPALISVMSCHCILSSSPCCPHLLASRCCHSMFLLVSRADQLQHSCVAPGQPSVEAGRMHVCKDPGGQ
jgi:hypothetical protein